VQDHATQQSLCPFTIYPPTVPPRQTSSETLPSWYRGACLDWLGWTSVVAALEGRPGQPRLPSIDGLDAAALAAGGRTRVVLREAGVGGYSDWDFDWRRERHRREWGVPAALLLRHGAAALTELDFSCDMPHSPFEPPPTPLPYRHPLAPAPPLRAGLLSL
jgi:hypothetical protein